MLQLTVLPPYTAFKRSEFAIINTDNPDDLPVEDIMPIEDKDGLKMNLRLHYERYPKSGGAFKVQVYTPYVVYNKTGLEFALKSKAPLSSAKNVAGHGIFKSDHRRKEAIPFLFSYDKRDARNRALLRIADSAWSEPLSFETVGTETAVAIPSSSGQEEITIGMKVTEGIGSVSRTCWHAVSSADGYPISSTRSSRSSLSTHASSSRTSSAMPSASVQQAPHIRLRWSRSSVSRCTGFAGVRHRS
jgi:vacuolar protein sorting-associated protein 13A/C